MTIDRDGEGVVSLELMKQLCNNDTSSREPKRGFIELWILDCLVASVQTDSIS